MKKSWDNKWYSDDFLRSLKSNAYIEHEGNLEYTVKFAPDAVSKTGIDPRMLGGPIGKTAKLLRFVPDFAFKFIKPSVNEKNLSSLRKSFAKSAYANCHIDDVVLNNGTATARDGYKIPIRIYKRTTDANDICLVFMHGGAFIGGALEPYDEFCKMLASKFGFKIISIDYRLLPENKYPTLYNDCFDVLLHIYKNNFEYGINKSKIFVCGDSAGGNLAQACTNSFGKSDMIRGQLLLYPSLNMFSVEDKYYKKGISDFKYEPTQKALSKGVVRQMEMLSNCNIKKIGILHPDPLNNPYSFGVQNNTPTFISAGSLDYLSKDAFAWAHKLADAGTDVKMVIYNGLGHGYINATGVFPQAEDVIDEMGNFIIKTVY